MGKVTYQQTAGDPQDDKANSQLCVQLTSFSRYSVGGGVNQVTAADVTAAVVTTTAAASGSNSVAGIVYFSGAMGAASLIAWAVTLLLTAIVSSVLLHF